MAGFDAVGEFDACYQLWQLVLTVEASPGANRPLRVFTLLHDAKPVLLNFGEAGGFDISPWADRVKLFDAKCDGVGAAGAWRGCRSNGRADPARWICCVG